MVENSIESTRPIERGDGIVFPEPKGDLERYDVDTARDRHAILALGLRVTWQVCVNILLLAYNCARR